MKAGPALRNLMPSEIQFSLSLNSFKINLRTFLYNMLLKIVLLLIIVLALNKFVKN